jgi:hypothetical protein
MPMLLVKRSFAQKFSWVGLIAQHSLTAKLMVGAPWGGATLGLMSRSALDLLGYSGGNGQWRAAEDCIDVRGGLIHSMQSNVERSAASLSPALRPHRRQSDPSIDAKIEVMTETQAIAGSLSARNRFAPPEARSL